MQDRSTAAAAIPTRVLPIAGLDLRFEQRPWAFAQARRAEIDAHFAGLQRDKPALWNGRVLLMHRHAFADGMLRGGWLETDFASFMAWRDWNFPDRAIRNCFAMAALQASDGAFLLGVMGGHTANGGRIYFPAGTPDPADVVDGRVDLEGSIRRELMEETGLDASTLEAEPGWHAVLAEPRIALMKVLRASEPAETLRARIRAHIAEQKDPELSDIHVVRAPTDFASTMPPFVTAFLRNAWR
jgi:8-oxo-dGTP pyrophosphatase MutT (NUDIX family)